MLRVITGTAKNIQLNVPEQGTRPLTDRIKTSIFDLISDFIPNAEVLDLYAGSGSFGIEALSRGASSATFVDIGNDAIACIEDNLARTNFLDKSIIVQNDINEFITSTDRFFDVIFLDPPFDTKREEDFNAMKKILKEDGILVLRIPEVKKKTFIEPETLENVYEKKYGKSIVKFYKLPQ